MGHRRNLPRPPVPKGFQHPEHAPANPEETRAAYADLRTREDAQARRRKRPTKGTR